jgi:hypothetical protein
MSNSDMSLANLLKVVVALAIVSNVAFGITRKIDDTHTDGFTLGFICLIVLSLVYDYQLGLLLIVLLLTVQMQKPKKKVSFNLQNNTMKAIPPRNSMLSDEEIARMTGSDEEEQKDADKGVSMNNLQDYNGTVPAINIGEDNANRTAASSDYVIGEHNLQRPEISFNSGAEQNQPDMLAFQKDNGASTVTAHGLIVPDEYMGPGAENDNLDESIKQQMYVPYEKLNNIQNNLLEGEGTHTEGEYLSGDSQYFEEIGKDYFPADE